MKHLAIDSIRRIFKIMSLESLYTFTFPAIISSHIDKDNLNSSFITSNVDFETLNVEF